MYRLLLLLLVVLSIRAAAQQSQPTVVLTKDSIPCRLNGPLWRFHNGPLANGADTALDDTSWPLVSSRLPVGDGKAKHQFTGEGWLRLHFTIDSFLASRPFAFTFQQAGASEVYLDGRLIEFYGVLEPDSAIEYFTAHNLPLVMQLSRPGRHLMAVRYVNKRYPDDIRYYGAEEAGFHGTFNTAGDAIDITVGKLSSTLTIFTLMAGIFGILALVHLILFLYYRAERSNARLSVFAAFCALMFAALPFIEIAREPEWVLLLTRLELFLIAGAAASLSVLLNGMFGKHRWHYAVVLIFSALVCILLIFYPSAYAKLALLIQFSMVMLEALFLLVGAVWRRVPGARIIGAGLMLLIAFVLICLAMVLVQGDVYLDGDTVVGIVLNFMLLLGVLSIPLSMSAYLAWRFASVSKNLQAQLLQVEALNAKTLEQEAEKQRLLENRQEELEREVALRTEELRRQKKKSDDLLLNILPEEVAEELKETGRSVARLYTDVSVLFTDFVDFTQMSEKLSPAALVAEIDTCFQAFDGIIERHGLEKIKTVGDAYIAVSGLPASNEQHARMVVEAALDIRDFMDERRRTNPAAFGIRLGVHSGPVVAGIVGLKKFAYDIWGDTVNTAARMEQHGEENKVNITAATFALVNERFVCSYRGELEAKHKGKLAMYFAERLAD